MSKYVASMTSLKIYVAYIYTKKITDELTIEFI